MKKNTYLQAQTTHLASFGPVFSSLLIQTLRERLVLVLVVWKPVLVVVVVWKRVPMVVVGGGRWLK
jgi:hypothetical protein